MLSLIHISDTLEKDCSYDVVQSVHEQLRGRLQEHKESRDPAPLELTVGEDVYKRQVSYRETEASPSAKLLTSLSPSLVPMILQMSAASLGLALPVKMCIRDRA